MIWPGPQEHRSLSLFFSFSRLVTCDCSVNLSRTWGSFELPPKWKGDFYQGMLIHFVENLLFNSCIFLKRLARHGVEPKKYRDLGQPCFYQPIFNKSWAEEYITYDGVGLQVSFCFFWAELLNLMFSGDSWGIWITCLSMVCTIQFLKRKHCSFLALHFWNHFFKITFFIVLMMALQIIF